MPAPLLETVEHETGASPRWAVLWLHGLGADGHDFAPIVPELARPGWPALRFVFPHAPVRPVTINNGMRMRAWYDIRNFSAEELGGGDRADSAGVLESVVQVEALVAREGERGVPPERIVLAGFSQGGAIALSAGLRRVQPLAGIVALSTYLPMAPQAAQFAQVGALGQGDDAHRNGSRKEVGRRSALRRLGAGARIGALRSARSDRRAQIGMFMTSW